MNRLKIIFIIILNFLILFHSFSRTGSHSKVYPATKESFPLLEVSGSYFYIGYNIGSHFKKQIQLSFKIRKEWFIELKRYIERDKNNYFQKLKEKARKFYPLLVEELRGMSAGSGVPFDDIFLLNVKAEISTKMKKEEKQEAMKCSTVYLIDDERKFIFHNEDGNSAYRDLIFMVKATPPSGVTFLTLTYPGHLMGNGPGINNHGIIQTTNYISTMKWKVGIPRYFLNRAVLEARSLDEAVKIVTFHNRAFAYHHNIASVKQKRILSIEVTTDNYQVVEPENIYYHTNHLILDKTKRFPQNTEYVNSSSLSRYIVISEAIKKLPPLKKVKIKDIFMILSSHKNAPYSPCRHPKGEVTGITLATALIDVRRGILKVFKGNPCKSFKNKTFTEYKIQF